MTTFRPPLNRRRVLAILTSTSALVTLPLRGALAQALTPDIGCTRMQDAIELAKRQLATLDIWVESHRQLQLADVMQRLPEVERILETRGRSLDVAEHDQFFNIASFVSSLAVLVCVVFAAPIAASLGISVVALGAGVFLGSMFVGLGLLIWDLSTRPSQNQGVVMEYVALREADNLTYAFANAPRGSLGAAEKVIKGFASYFVALVALWNLQKVLSGASAEAEKDQAYAAARDSMSGLKEDLQRMDDPETFKTLMRDNYEGVVETLTLISGVACPQRTSPSQP